MKPAYNTLGNVHDTRLHIPSHLRGQLQPWIFNELRERIGVILWTRQGGKIERDLEDQLLDEYYEVE